jgi:hypothetical protein
MQAQTLTLLLCLLAAVPVTTGPAHAANVLTWADGPDEYYYIIEYRRIPGYYRTLAAVARDVTTYTDTMAGTSAVCYRLYAATPHAVRSPASNEFCLNLPGNRPGQVLDVQCKEGGTP